MTEIIQQEKNENPNYYAIIPANVRYDKELPAMAKLLYGEITCLTQKEGFCWAGNSYFADLYEMSISRISKLIALLEARGYISIKVERNKNKEVIRRLIRIKSAEITGAPVKNNSTLPPKITGGIAENDKDNIINNNTINNNNTSECGASIEAPAPADPQTPPKEPKHKHGELKNVLLTDTELNKLKKDYGEQRAMQAIEYFSEKKAMKGYKYKSDYLALRSWVFDALDEVEQRKARNRATQRPQMTNDIYRGNGSDW